MVLASAGSGIDGNGKPPVHYAICEIRTSLLILTGKEAVADQSAQAQDWHVTRRASCP
jgi:hypothetical protein